MTTEESIKMLERIQDPEPYEPQITKRAYDALQMGVDALKKQIPMKPKRFDLHSAFIPRAYCCPYCGVMLDEPVGENRIPKWKNDILYCASCGQAIDWSDYEIDYRRSTEAAP